MQRTAFSARGHVALSCLDNRVVSREVCVVRDFAKLQLVLLSLLFRECTHVQCLSLVSWIRGSSERKRPPDYVC